MTVTEPVLHPALLGLSQSQGGVFTRAQALQHGYPVDEVTRLLRAKLWHRVRRGSYVADPQWPDRDERSRHAIAVRASLLAIQTPVVVSHVSAAVLHDLPLLHPDLSLVHVTREDTATRVEARVRHHTATLDAEEVMHVDGVPVTALAKTATDVALHGSFRQGLVTMDAAMAQGVTKDQVEACLRRCRNWSGVRGARRVRDFADGRAQSPGESLTRLVLAEQGFPPPEPQARIYDSRGQFVAQVDLLFGLQRTVVEFDGKSKYGIDGQDPREQLFREKQREDRLRELGFQVVRLLWDDLSTPTTVAARVRAAFARAEGAVTMPLAVLPSRA